jgi:hypothetical protein
LLLLTAVTLEPARGATGEVVVVVELVVVVEIPLAPAAALTELDLGTVAEGVTMEPVTLVPTMLELPLEGVSDTVLPATGNPLPSRSSTVTIPEEVPSAGIF